MPQERANGNITEQLRTSVVTQHLWQERFPLVTTDGTNQGFCNKLRFWDDQMLRPWLSRSVLPSFLAEPKTCDGVSRASVSTAVATTASIKPSTLQAQRRADDVAKYGATYKHVEDITCSAPQRFKIATSPFCPVGLDG